jgi:hypothetical protein
MGRNNDQGLRPPMCDLYHIHAHLNIDMQGETRPDIAMLGRSRSCINIHLGSIITYQHSSERPLNLHTSASAVLGVWNEKSRTKSLPGSILSVEQRDLPSPRVRPRFETLCPDGGSQISYDLSR